MPVVTRAQLKAQEVVAHCVVDFKCPGSGGNSDILDNGYTVGVAIDGVVPCTIDLIPDAIATHNSTKVISMQWKPTVVDPDGDGLFVVQCFVVGSGCPCNQVIENQTAGRYAVTRLLIDDSKYTFNSSLLMHFNTF